MHAKVHNKENLAYNINDKSQSNMELEQSLLNKESPQKIHKETNWSMAKRLYDFSQEKKLYFFLGIIIALINGTIFPIMAIFLGKIITVLG